MPHCCLCSIQDPSLLIVSIYNFYYLLFQELHDTIFVHCVCLKALASFLYLNVDDSYIYKDLNMDVFNKDTISCQLFSNCFVTFFREHYRPLKNQFYHLSCQFVDFLTSVFPSALNGTSSVLFSIDNGSNKCIYCSLSDNLLVKCQHADCMTFCHFPCYLRHHNYTCHHKLFKNTSVALLFFCDEHCIDAKKQTPVSNNITTVTRFMERKVRIKEEALQTLNAVLSNQPTRLVDQQVLLALRQFPTLLELDPQRCSTLKWITTETDVKEADDSIIIKMPMTSQPQCAICHDILGNEVFPQLSSRVAVCQSCNVSVHCFCEKLSDKERKNWKCSHCRYVDNPPHCFYCKKKDGFLSSFIVNTTTIYAHYPCYFHSLLPINTYECDCCHSQNAVFRCCVPGCSYSRDFLCSEQDKACFLFYPQGGSTLFLFFCPSHIMAIPYFLKTIPSSSYPSIILPLSQQTLCHPLRSILSFTSVRVYNNTSAYVSLKTFFLNSNHFSKRRKKQQALIKKKEEEEYVEPEEKLKPEDKLKPTEKPKPKEKPKPEEKPKPKEKSKPEEKPKPGKAEHETKEPPLYLLNEDVTNRPQSDKHQQDFSCEDLWNLVDSYFWKKTGKRDIQKLLRKTPRSVVSLYPFDYRLFLYNFLREQSNCLHIQRSVKIRRLWMSI